MNPDQILALLSSSHPDMASDGQQKLKALGSAALDFLPSYLMASVQATSAMVRRAALEALPLIDLTWQSQANIQPEVVTLSFLLGDVNQRLAHRAMDRLILIGRSAFPQLLRSTVVIDEQRRDMALRCLNLADPNWGACEELHPQIEELLEKLDASYAEVAAAARDILIRVGKPAIPYLFPGMLDPNHGQQEKSRRLLEAIDQEWYGYLSLEEVAPKLIASLGSKHKLISDSAYRILESLDEQVFSWLTDALETHVDHKLEVKTRVIQLIGNASIYDDRSVELLVENWTWSDNYEYRSSTILALHKIGYDEPSVLLPLIRELDNESLQVRQEAVEYLESLGSVAERASLALVMLLADENKHLVHAVRQALVAIGQGAGPSLAAVLNDGDRNAMAKVLTDYYASFYTVDLERVKRDPVNALNNMGWARHFAANEFKRIQQKKIIIIELLDEFDYRSSDLIKVLQSLLDHENEELKDKAKQLYQKIQL